MNWPNYFFNFGPFFSIFQSIRNSSPPGGSAAAVSQRSLAVFASTGTVTNSLKSYFIFEFIISTVLQFSELCPKWHGTAVGRVAITRRQYPSTSSQMSAFPIFPLLDHRTNTVASSQQSKIWPDLRLEDLILQVKLKEIIFNKMTY